MGFKRSSEGRVYFQSTGSGELKQSSASIPNGNGRNNGHFQHTQKNPVKESGPTQKQILSLLKSLNERLRVTQSERDYLRNEMETYKGLVLDLRKKAEQQDNHYKTLEEKVTGSEKAARSSRAVKMAEEAFKELEETRKIVAELETRADKNESDLKKQVSLIRQNEASVQQRQAQLEKIHNDQNSEFLKRLEGRHKELCEKQDEKVSALNLRISKSEEKVSSYEEKFEEAMVNTEKLERKIDKEMQERARLIRKLERIEETVIQTHDALNAKAMVLLTDQSIAAQTHLPQTPAVGGLGVQDVQPEQGPEKGPVESTLWWKRSIPLNAKSIAAVVLIAVLSGWGIANIQKPAIPDLVLPGFELLKPGSQKTADNELLENAGSENLAEQFLADDDPPVASQKETAEKESADLGKSIDNFIENGTQPDPVNDIGAEDITEKEKILAVLEENPDKLAEQLNDIEPVALPPADKSAEEVKHEQPEDSQTANGLEKSEDKISEEAKTKPAKENAQTASVSKQEKVAKSPGPAVEAGIRSRISVDKSLPSAIKEIENDAFEGVAEAQHDLAAIYIAGHGGVKQNYDRAAQWFEEAARNGVSNASYNLGVLYHQGIGVEQDLAEAIYWYQDASEKGHPEAQYNLGIAHIEGLGLPYDPEKAVHYFKNAARAGVMEAAYNLGLIFENGLLGKAQPDRALMWYKTAADAGSPEAKAALEQLAKTVGVGLGDVNRLVDSMKDREDIKSDSTKTASDVKTKTTEQEGSAAQKVSGYGAERQLTAQVQQQLMNLGLYPGPANGLNGPLTEDAVRSYQSAYDLKPTGKVSEELLAHMKEISSDHNNSSL